MHAQLVHDARFHELIFEAAGNALLLEVWRSLHAEIRAPDHLPPRRRRHGRRSSTRTCPSWPPCDGATRSWRARRCATTSSTSARSPSGRRLQHRCTERCGVSETCAVRLPRSPERGRGTGPPRRARLRGPAARGRPEPRPADEHPPRDAVRRDRHQPDRRAGRHRPATNGALRIGAVARQRACETSPHVRDGAPLFAEAVGQVAHPSVRRRGTAVGSVAFADPSAELPDRAARARRRGRRPAARRGERTIAADDFFTGPFTSALAPDELAVALRIPATAAAPGSAFVEESRRHGELPMCGVAAVVTLDDDGRRRAGPHRALRRAPAPDPGPRRRGGAAERTPRRRAAPGGGRAGRRRPPTRSATATARPPSAATSPRCSTRRALATAISRAEERNA